MKKIVQFVGDLVVTYSLEKRSIRYKISAVLKVLYWHGILKRISRGFEGTYQGLRFFYDTMSDGCALTYILEYLEFPVLWWVSQTLGRNDVFIDIGSNIGNYSLVAAKKGAKVFAFEPNPEVMRIQQIQVLLNNIKSISLHQTAVGDLDKKVTFFQQSLGKSGISSLYKSGRDAMKVVVQMTTIDSVMRDFKIKNLTTLKMDAEGAEKLIFDGMKSTLKKQKVRYIIWEITSLRANNSLDDSILYLRKFGYNTIILGEPNTASTAITFHNLDQSARRLFGKYYEDLKKGHLV